MTNNTSIDFPPLIEWNDYQNYSLYEEALLKVYRKDLWNSNLTFNGLKVLPRVHRMFELNGKKLDHTFVHITSKGKVEENRDLDLSRCEKIGFIKPIIENCHLPCVKVWKNFRDYNGKIEEGIVFFCEEVNCKIVLKEIHRNGRLSHYAIRTFYLINKEHKIASHKKEYLEFIKNYGNIVETP